MGGLIEKESCITTRHSRCWNATSRLKSAREEGAGFGQITRAYYASGRLRFDALAELKAKHPELAAWNWGNVYVRPDLQLLAIVLKLRDNWVYFAGVPAEEDRIRFAVKSYNRGLGGVKAEMQACRLMAGCTPTKFVGHAGEVCTASRKVIYGRRSACDISLKYVPDVYKRAIKYIGWLR